MASTDGSGKSALEKQLDECLARLKGDPENPHSLERKAYLLVRLEQQAMGVATYYEAARNYARIGLVHRALDVCARILLLEPHHMQAVELQKELEDEDDDQTLTPPAWEPAKEPNNGGSAAPAMAPMLGLPQQAPDSEEQLVTDWNDEPASVADSSGADHTLEVDDLDVVSEGRASSAEVEPPRTETDEIPIQVDLSQIDEAPSGGDADQAVVESAPTAVADKKINDSAEQPGVEPASTEPSGATADKGAASPRDRRDSSVVELGREAKPQSSRRSHTSSVDEIEPPEFFNLLQTVTDLQSTISDDPVNPRVAMPVGDSPESGRGHHVICDSLPLALLPDDYQEHAERRVVEAGSYISREQERSNHLMVLLRGRAEVTKLVGRGSRQERVVYLGTLEQDACVGELALLGDGRRHASVKAMDDCELLMLPKSTVKEWMTESPKLNRTLRGLYRHRLQKWLKKSSSLFDGLDEETANAFLKKCKPKAVKANTKVLKKGESAPGLFLVLLGMVDVYNPLGDEWGDLLLHRLSDGDFFGEIPLMLERPSPADYVTRTFSQLMVISYDDLFAFGLEAPSTLRHLDDEAKRRLKGYHSITAGEAQFEGGDMVYLLDNKKRD